MGTGSYNNYDYYNYTRLLYHIIISSFQSQRASAAITGIISKCAFVKILFSTKFPTSTLSVVSVEVCDPSYGGREGSPTSTLQSGSRKSEVGSFPEWKSEVGSFE